MWALHIYEDLKDMKNTSPILDKGYESIFSLHLTVNFLYE